MDIKIIEIHNRLKNIRESLNINQLELSEILGIRQSYYSEMETGKRPVGVKVIKKLRELYNISSDWMYSGSGDIYIAKVDKEDTLKSVPSLSTITAKSIKRKNWVAFYLDMTDDQLELELSIAIENLSDEYKDYSDLIEVLHSLNPPARLLEKFPKVKQFTDYKAGSEDEFDLLHSHVKKPGLLKALKILYYLDDAQHFRGAISKVISWMHRYSEMQMLNGIKRPDLPL
jgi:transcriptional regulator with XRE-family HTH domain